MKRVLIIGMNENDYQLKNNRNEILDKQFTVYDPSGLVDIEQVTVVGIAYNDKSYDYNTTLYMPKSILSSLLSNSSCRYPYISA